MKILLEGPDKTGKSTLSRALTELYNAEYFHFSYEKDNDIFFEQISNIDLLLDSNRNIIVDRYIPSEIVYGKICRGKDRISELEQKCSAYDDYTNEHLRKFDMIIFCLPYNYDKYMLSLNNYSSENDKFEYKLADGKEKDIYQSYQDYYLNLLVDEDLKEKVFRYDYFKVI